MRDLWLTERQVRELTGWARRSVARKAASGELRWRNAGGGRGRKPREYAAHSPAALYEIYVMSLYFYLLYRERKPRNLSSPSDICSDSTRIPDRFRYRFFPATH